MCNVYSQHAAVQNTHAIGGCPEEVFLRIKDHGGDAKFISTETASKPQLLEVEFILHSSKLTHHAVYGADIDGLTRRSSLVSQARPNQPQLSVSRTGEENYALLAGRLIEAAPRSGRK